MASLESTLTSETVRPTREKTRTPHVANVATAERWASALGGGALVYYGLRKRSPGGLLLAALGVPLLKRAISGHCNLYGKLGINTTRKHGASTLEERGVHIEESVVIARPLAEVYRFCADFGNAPRYAPHLFRLETLAGNRVAGACVDCQGREHNWKAELTAQRENETIEWRSEDATYENAGALHFAATPDGQGTEVRLTLEFHPPAGLLGHYLSKMRGHDIGCYAQETLRRLKAVLEKGGPAKG